MNNYNQLPIRPITCPVCGNTRLAYVTEYHKCIVARIINSIILAMIIALIFFLIIVSMSILEIGDTSSTVPIPSNYESLLEQSKKTSITICSISIVALFIIFIIIQIIIFVKESKTHVCAICSNCGKIWNLN